MRIDLAAKEGGEKFELLTTDWVGAMCKAYYKLHLCLFEWKSLINCPDRMHQPNAMSQM